uniref:Uncharacterized protein n=1 Tax=Sciurus vulgaris TaxID=55149 RepID=A0A8D2E100_SCIVU
MHQPLQLCNLRIKLLRRLEEPRCLSSSECLFATGVGMLMVTLGICVIVRDFSDPMALSIGMTIMATGFFFIVLTGALALCAARQHLQRAGRQRLEEERKGSPPDGTGPSVIASTFL